MAYDLIMLAVIIGAIIFGAIKGMAWQIASLASLVVSYFVAAQFAPQIAPHIAVSEPLNKVLAIVLIYLATSLIIWVLFRFVARFIDRLKLKEFDRQMGAVLGLAKGVLWCIVITFFAVLLTEGTRREAILTSRSGYYIGYLIDRAPLVMPERLHQTLKPHLDDLDEQLHHDHVEFEHGEDGWKPVPVEIHRDEAHDEHESHGA